MRAGRGTSIHPNGTPLCAGRGPDYALGVTHTSAPSGDLEYSYRLRPMTFFSLIVLIHCITTFVNNYFNISFWTFLTPTPFFGTLPFLSVWFPSYSGEPISSYDGFPKNIHDPFETHSFAHVIWRNVLCP